MGALRKAGVWLGLVSRAIGQRLRVNAPDEKAELRAAIERNNLLQQQVLEELRKQNRLLENNKEGAKTRGSHWGIRKR